MFSLSALREQYYGPLLGRLVPAQVRAYRPSVLFCICAFTMVSSLLLGGGTRGGFLSDAILELFAAPAFLISLSSLIGLLRENAEVKDRARWALVLCFAIVLLPLIQLVPLPPWIWTELPGREAVSNVFDLLGRALPWMPISVSPNSTWLSVLSLLAPFAIFLGTLQLSFGDRRRLSLIVVAVGIVSAFIGLAQVAQGPASPLRFFAFTNNMEAVGFFANRNHFAALGYVVLLFAAPWAIDAAFKAGPLTDEKSIKPFVIVSLTASFVVLTILIIGETMARSRAGLGLTIVALAGTFAMVFADQRKASGVTPSKLLLGATAVAIILAVQFTLYRILDRFGTDPVEDARIQFAHNTIQAAKSFMPFGSGMGTFVPVYGMFEQPQDILANAYANHAHDDFLELWLETGVVGMAILAAFLIWFVLRSVNTWSRTPRTGFELDRYLARAATMVIALLAVHSVVDYPLRTGAIMAVFAFACALLVEPLGAAASERRLAGARSSEPIGHKAPKRAAANSPRPEPSLLRTAKAGEVATRTARGPGGKWGEDIDWPEVWRNQEKQKQVAEESVNLDKSSDK